MGDNWKITGVPTSYRGVILRNGEEVWSCPHEHDSQRGAARCAKMKFDSMKGKR